MKQIHKNEFKLVIDKIFDEENNSIDVVRHPKQIISIYIPETVYKYDLIRKQNY